MKKAAKALNGDACEALGNYYSTRGNKKEALHYYRLGYWLNHFGAMYEYAFLCKEDGENNYHAQRIIEHAANYEHPKAVEFLAWAYLNGNRELGIEADHSKHPHFYFEMLADQGNEKAILQLVELYREDNRSYPREAKSNAKAINWLTKGKEAGYPSAMIMLADANYYGNLGVTKNMQAAFSLYLESANKGIISPTLITCYEKGEGVKRDKTAAASWKAKYAQQQNMNQ